MAGLRRKTLMGLLEGMHGCLLGRFSLAQFGHSKKKGVMRLA